MSCAAVIKIQLLGSWPVRSGVSVELKEPSLMQGHLPAGCFMNVRINLRRETNLDLAPQVNVMKTNEFV